VTEGPIFLSTLPAQRRDRLYAAIVVGVSAAVFLAAVPFAKQPLPPVWAFIPIYESALVVNDLVTAILLFGQFSFLRSRALLLLATGYLFTAFIAIAHALMYSTTKSRSETASMLFAEMELNSSSSATISRSSG